MSKLDERELNVPGEGAPISPLFDFPSNEGLDEAVTLDAEERRVVSETPSHGGIALNYPLFEGTFSSGWDPFDYGSGPQEGYEPMSEPMSDPMSDEVGYKARSLVSNNEPPATSMDLAKRAESPHNALTYSRGSSFH